MVRVLECVDADFLCRDNRDTRSRTAASNPLPHGNGYGGGGCKIPVMINGLSTDDSRCRSYA